MIVKLNDVVDRIKGNVDRFNTDLIYYVGGEHYESSRIAIYTPGLLDSEKGATLGFKFHFPFQKGDVLFMARNPHLRKAGMVMFDGICSDASYILRTKDSSVLLQEYLALIVQCDRFWDFFEANKSGSVNYLMNWKELQNYEFDLPSIEEQRKIADLAWAIERTRVAYEGLIRATDKLVKSQFIEMFGNPLTNDKKWNTMKMKEVAPSTSYSGAVSECDDGYWLLNLDMIESNTGRIISKVYVPKEEIGQSTTSFSSEYVLFSKLRPYLNKVVIPDAAGYATTELVTLLPNKQHLTQVFLSYLLRSDEFLKYISSQVSGTKMPRVTMSVFWNFDVILPPVGQQKLFAAFVQQTDKSKFELTQALEALNATYKKLISENLG